MLNKKPLFICALALSLAGCGGGAGGDSGDSNGGGKSFASAFTTSTAADCHMKLFAPNGMPIESDILLFGDGNVGYRTCNDELYVGTFAITSSTSSAGEGTTQFTIYKNGAGVRGKTEVLTGAVLFNGSYASMIDLRTPSGAIGVQGRTAGALTNSIAGSYSTLAGDYDGLNATMTIGADGKITGTTEYGALSGTITKFRSDTHVHNVSFTITSSGGMTSSFTGVLGPQQATVVLSGISQNAGYTKVFWHK